MKKLLSLLLVSIAVSGCQNVQPSAINQNKIVETNVTQLKAPLTFSFSVKAESATRIKSIDAYLVEDSANPSGSLATNTNNPGYKLQKDVSNGVVNFTFTNYPDNGTYYVALQAFDDLIAGSSRDNITVDNTAITSGDKNYAVSTNTVTITNRVITYSDSQNSLKLVIALKEANNIPVGITPSNGSSTPTNNISVSEIENNPI